MGQVDVMHLFISPHLDDALLSCGGTIARLVGEGESTVVVTIFAGGGVAPFSRLGDQLHHDWGDPPDPVRLRKAEDEAAVARVGARAKYLDFPEALYRRAPDGTWMYPSGESLFETPHALDGGLVSPIAERMLELGSENTRLYAPMGIGEHADHMLAYESARMLEARGCDVVYYEDKPYALDTGMYGARLSGHDAWQAVTLPVRRKDLLAQASALAYYRTQIPVLFGNQRAMVRRLGDFNRAAAQTGEYAAERYWRAPARGALLP